MAVDFADVRSSELASLSTLDLVFIEKEVLPVLAASIFTLRDLVLEDRVSHYRASDAVKDRLRSAGSFQNVSEVEVESACRLLLKTYAELPRSGQIPGSVPQSEPERTQIAPAPQIFGLSRPTYKSRFQPLFDTLNNFHSLQIDSAETPRGFDPDHIINLANNYQVKLSDMQNEYSLSVEHASMEDPPRTSAERYSRYRDYYASESPPSAASESEEISTAPVTRQSASDLTNDVNMLEALKSAGLLPPSASGIPPELTTMLLALQRSGKAPPPTAEPLLITSQQPPMAMTVNDAREPLRLQSDEADEYDPLALGDESDYDPDEEPTHHQQETPIYSPAAPASFDAFVAPQPSPITTHTVSKMDLSQQANGGGERRESRREMKRAEQRAKREQKRKVRDDTRAREKREISRREEKHHRNKAHQKPQPSSMQSPHPAPRREISTQTQQLPPPPRPIFLYPPPPPPPLPRPNTGHALPMPPPPHPGPGHFPPPTPILPQSVTRYELQQPQPPYPNVGYLQQPQPMSHQIPAVLPYGAPVPYQAPAIPYHTASVAPLTSQHNSPFTIPNQLGPVRMLAEGETAVVHDQFGNTYLAKPVPRPQSAVGGFTY